MDVEICRVLEKVCKRKSARSERLLGQTRGDPRSSGSARKIAAQGIVPTGHVDVEGVEAVGRQNGVGGAARGAGKFGGGYWVDFGGQAGGVDDFCGEIKPGAVAGVGGVDDALGICSAELDQC